MSDASMSAADERLIFGKVKNRIYEDDPSPIKMINPEYVNDLWAVPLIRMQSKYDEDWKIYVFVGNKMKRVFSSATLPDCIKEKLAMVIVMAESLPKTLHPYGWSNVLPHTWPEPYRYIGWACKQEQDHECYVVALSYEELLNVRGET